MNISEIIKSHQIVRKHEAVFLFLPGPSLLNISPIHVKEIYKHCDIISVKQGLKKTKTHTRFHIINQNNLEKYADYKNMTTIAVCVQNTKSKIYGKVDVLIPQKIDFSKLDERLGVKGNVEDFSFENVEYLTWGPGIVNEFVFYFIEHLGYKRVFINGMDYANPNDNVKKLTHSYDKKNCWFRNVLENLIKNERLRYKLGFIYNKAGMMPIDENKLLIKLSYLFYEYFKGKNIEMYLVESPMSFASNNIPRISIGRMLGLFDS
jgi:hypothetical protein